MKIRLRRTLFMVICVAGFVTVQADEISQALSAAKDYDFSLDRRPLVRVEALIRTAEVSTYPVLEKQILVALQETRSPGYSDFLCRQLSTIGSEESVPLLVELLQREETYDVARYALERIGGPLVDRQLRLLLPSVSDSAKIGLIVTLGVRADVEAVAMLTTFVKGRDELLIKAAASALGSIGTVEAVAVLAETQATSVTMRSHLLDAQLQAAEALGRAGLKTESQAVYMRLYGVENPPLVRAAALRGVIQLDPGQASARLILAWDDPDPAVKEAAIMLLPKIQNPQILNKLVTGIGDLAPRHQVMVLTTLVAMRYVEGLATVVKQVESASPRVRVAALQALGVLGNAASIDLLVTKAAEAQDEEQAAARRSLVVLGANGVDERLVSRLALVPAKEQLELMWALAERHTVTASTVLLSLTQSESRLVQQEAYKTLAKVAQGMDLQSLVDLLVGKPSKMAEDTIVAVALRARDQVGYLDPVLKAYDVQETGPVQASLLRVFGRVGEAQGLPLIVTALASEEPKLRTEALRALSLWPTAEPQARLLVEAQKSESLTDHVLALRGVINMAVMTGKTDTDQAVVDLKAAWAITRRPEEKKLILGALPNTACVSALEFAQQQVTEAVLIDDVHYVLVALGKSLVDQYPQQVRAALEPLLEDIQTGLVKQQALQVLEQVK